MFILAFAKFNSLFKIFDKGAPTRPQFLMQTEFIKYFQDTIQLV
jgi:hypothetical protein